MKKMNGSVKNHCGYGQRAASLLVTAVMVISSLAPPASPQITQSLPRVTITRPPTKMKPGVLRAVSRPPIPFKPLEVIDPRTGKPVPPTAILKLDDGKPITAAKYYEQMNKLEAGLNKFGLSVRDQQKESVLAETTFDKAKALAQARSMKSVVPSAKMAPQLDRLAQNQRAYVRSVDPFFGKIPGRPGPTRISRGFFMEKVLGTAVSAAPNGSTPLTGTPKLLKKRPDLAPGNSVATGLGSDVETLPGISLEPGLAQPGKRASSIQINAGWSNIGFYVNYLASATGPLAPRYVWQVAKASPALDNFGAFAKPWSTDFTENEMAAWKTVPGLMGTGSVAFLKPGSGPSNKEHLFFIDFAKLAGAPPAKPVFYLVRVAPVNADGSIAGYPSRPVLVSYGAEAPVKVTLPPYVPPPMPKLPVVNTTQHAPYSIGDPSIMALDLDTWMTSNGTVSQNAASVGFEASCHVLGQPFSLLKISAAGDITQRSLDSNGKPAAPSKVHGAVSYYILGDQAACENCEQTETGYLDLPVDYSLPLDQGFTFGFPIGPIDVSGTIGFRGAIGFGAHVGLSAGSIGVPLTIQAGPHVSAHVYMEAAAGIGVGGFDVLAVGVGGEVNLLTAGFVVGVKINPFAGNEYFGRVSELQVLGGSLYGFAKVGICPFCKKWKVTLFDWPGYDMLVSDPGKTTLFAGSF